MINRRLKLLVLYFLLLFNMAGVFAKQDLAFSVSKLVNVKTVGAEGNGKADDTQAIINAITLAYANKTGGVYFPKGTYLIKQKGVKAGIIKLMDGVSLIGAGPNVCHIVLSGGRFNPNSLFYQDWQRNASINNVTISGIDFNGNLLTQRYAADYQFCHALSINNGRNITIKNCKFQSFRGDGVLFGDTFEPSLNSRIVSNVAVHDCEFYNIYREGAMFCCVNGARFYNNYVHGNGYLVGGVDIERHSGNESVQNVAVYNNLFRFTDGYGPIERGRKVRYRRAVTMGYFYEGYPCGVADSLSGGHMITNNQIYQGQIDCFGHVNVTINRNKIVNALENIKGLKFVSQPAINVSDAGKTSGLQNVKVTQNYIQSGICGNGIVFYNYNQVLARDNILKGNGLGKVALVSSSGDVETNTYE